MSYEQNCAHLHDAITAYVPVERQAEMEKFLKRIMKNESGGNTHAKNPNGSAAGLFQFVQSTWSHYGNGKSVYDPQAQCDAAVRFALDNEKQMEKVLGRAPTAGEYYLAHFLGPAGACAVLKADENTPLSQIISDKAISSNAGVSLDGKMFRLFDAGDVKEWTNRKMGVANPGDRIDEKTGEPMAQNDVLSKLLDMVMELLQKLFQPGEAEMAPAMAANAATQAKGYSRA